MGDGIKSLDKLPSHLAIIMDGNGRWARANKLSRLDGHKRGGDVADDVVRFCTDLKIPYLTLYAFSSENWRRSHEEVSGLMGLLQHYLESRAEELHKNNVCLKIIGEREMLPNTILNLVEDVENLTKSNTAITVQMALSYGSRSEIVHAAKEIAEKVRDYRLDINEITEEVFENHLYTKGIPDPDLLIRTSGEMRISNYLLWQLAYTELYFTDKYWPDFTRDDLMDALLEYQERERRFGTAA